MRDQYRKDPEPMNVRGQLFQEEKDAPPPKIPIFLVAAVE
jgi:hypothetical protein